MTLKAILALFDVLPGWIWAALLSLCFAFGVVESFQLAHLRVVHANLVADVANAARASEHAAREDAVKVAEVQFRHAEIQQENSDEATKREAARVARDRALAADNDRLRSDILAASDRHESAPDAAACRRDADLARQLGSDLAEAVGLQGEAEATIRKRDGEVKRLLDVILNDRAAVEAQ